MSGLGELTNFFRSLIQRLPLCLVTAFLIYLPWPEWWGWKINLYTATINTTFADPQFAKTVSLLGLDKVAPIILIGVVVAIAEVHYSILIRLGALFPPHIVYTGIPQVHWTVLRDSWKESGEKNYNKFEEFASRSIAERMSGEKLVAGVSMQIGKAYAIMGAVLLIVGGHFVRNSMLIVIVVGCLVWLVSARAHINDIHRLMKNAFFAHRVEIEAAGIRVSDKDIDEAVLRLKAERLQPVRVRFLQGRDQDYFVQNCFRGAAKLFKRAQLEKSG